MIAGSSSEVKSLIEQEINNNPIVVFMKGTPDFPMCGFSGKVVQIFRHYNYEVHGINILENEHIRQGIKDYTKWPTLPQVFVKGEFVGGCDILSEMAESGELLNLLNEKVGK